MPLIQQGRFVLAAAFACVSLLVSCSKAGHYETLKNLSQFREAFNEDEGSIRLVLLLSPT